MGGAGETKFAGNASEHAPDRWETVNELRGMHPPQKEYKNPRAGHKEQ